MHDDVDRACCASRRGTAPAFGRWRRRRPPRRERGRLHLVDQLVGDVHQLLGRERRRLLHEVDRAGVERRQDLLPGFRRDADDDDRDRLPRHLLAHEGDAVHHRHVEIAGHDVGLQLGDQLERLVAVARRADDLDERDCARASATRPCGRRPSRRRRAPGRFQASSPSDRIDHRASRRRMRRRAPRARTATSTRSSDSDAPTQRYAGDGIARANCSTTRRMPASEK